MKLYVKYDVNVLCRKVIEEQLNELGLSYSLKGCAELEIKSVASDQTLNKLYSVLNSYGINVVESSKSIFIQKIKDVIVEMVYMDEKLPNLTISMYLANKLGFSYGYISNIFAEVTYTSIENFIILQRIEFAKQLITHGDHSFSEIANRLNYSSLAHFCTQFKNTTGLTPTAFRRIINKRRSAVDNT